MNKIDLIVTDLDGTILNEGVLANDIDIKTLKEAQKQGIKVAIATGQSWETAKDIALKLDIDKYLNLIICNNGAVISPADNFDPIAIETLEDGLIKQLWLIAEKFNVCMYGFRIEQATAYWNGINCPSKNLANINWFDFFKTIDIKYLNKFDDVLQVMLFVEEDKQLEFENYIDQFKNQWVETQNDVEDIPIFEFNSIKANKGQGVLNLIKKININAENVAVFGDNENDISMFKAITNSVAMENGPEHVKQIAKYQTSSNINAGVSEFIMKNILK